ncbi:M24 family metallopeptidase [Chloroflexota bacterium]
MVSTLHPFTLPLEERDRRWKNIRTAMEKRGLECLIVWGSYCIFRDVSASLQYLTNVGTEGYVLFPLDSEPTLYAFEGGLEPTWVQDWRSGHPKYSAALTARLKELHLESARIGVAGLSGYYGEMGFPHATYTSLADSCPNAKLEDATDIVEDARMVKSEAEIRCMELACEIGEKVIQVVVDTAKAGAKDYEVRAAMMDTMFRNGGEPGSMILYCQGKGPLLHAGQNQLYHEPPSSKVLELGDVILIEFDAIYLGYRAQYNQPFSMGEPSKEWQDIASAARKSFESGFKALKPGITTGELEEAFLGPIKEAGYIYANPAFHGLGLGLEMPMGSYPRQAGYKPDLSFVVKENMVFEFEPHPVTPDFKKSVHLGSPVLVTNTGCRLLSKNWKPELQTT